MLVPIAVLSFAVSLVVVAVSFATRCQCEINRNHARQEAFAAWQTRTVREAIAKREACRVARLKYPTLSK
jgi:hypothetical protein